MLTDPLAQATLLALTTAHKHLALTRGQALRYPADVAPFAALHGEPTPAALQDLTALLAPAESIYLIGERPPETSGLRWDGVIPCLQMVFPEDAPLPPEALPAPEIYPLTCKHSSEMLALINVAYPGFFRAQTCRMGRYWGIRDVDGTLIAMGGERLVLAMPGQGAWPEISGLCTDPSRPGKGLGTAILRHILAQHCAEGARSWLHVTSTNTRAVALYRRLGFQMARAVDVHRIQRTAS